MSRWYCKIDSQILGPFEFEELRFLKERGQLAAGDFVRDGSTSDWRRADAIDGLFPGRAVAPKNTGRPAQRKRPPRRPAAPTSATPAGPPPPEIKDKRNSQPAIWITVATAALLLVVVMLLLLLLGNSDDPSTGSSLAGNSGKKSGRPTADADADATTGKKSSGDAGRRTNALASALKRTINRNSKRSRKTTGLNPKWSGPSGPASPESNRPTGSQSVIGTQFFGHRADGKGFVYVVDCSGSMSGKPFEKARRELLRSIHNLSAKQSFYVIFFSDDSYPMFSPLTAERRLLAASTGNVARVTKWVNEFQVVGGTSPQTALLKAISLKPDAIFFLTDGGFDASVATTLRQRNSAKIPIYAICFQSNLGETLLKKMAADSGGKYRFVP